MRKRFHIAAIIGAVMAVVLFNSFREKPIPVPLDDDHRPLLERVARGGSPEEAEKECLACHSPQSTPLSENHTSNKKCLVCHPG